MMGFEVKYDDKSSVVLNGLMKNAEAFMEEVGGELLSQTQRNSRVDTGKTKGSYSKKVEIGSTSAAVHVGSSYQNAIYEEYGTGEFALKCGKTGGWTYRAADGTWHHTHGKRPNRPLYNAFNSKKAQIIARAKQIAEGL